MVRSKFPQCCKSNVRNKTGNRREDADTYILMNRLILSMVGLYPKNGLRCLTVAFFMLLIVVPQVLQIYHSTDLGVILETSSVLLTILLALLKMIVWTLKSKDMSDLISYMFDDYWKVAKIGDETPSCFLRYARFARTFTRCYFFLVLNALLLFCGSPFVRSAISVDNESVNKSRTFLFPAMYPEGWTQRPLYEIALVSQVIATFSCAAVVLAIDTIVATSLFLTCGQFKIVQNNLRGLGNNEANNDETGERGQRGEESARQNRQIVDRDKLTTYIDHHRAVIKFSDKLNRLFSPIMLCQVLASNLIICLVGLQMTSTLTDEGKVLKYFAYLMMALYQLMMFCLPGDDLINQSSAVSDAAYSTNWYLATESFKADVIFVIVRGQKPSRITAGKFNVMCMEHFGTVLSASMSYFMVLRSFSQGDYAAR
ncbi:odorant receptor 13a-like [Athalia rosae]|uniref:odorant receptor 13a-like n=1 Tax=Athalia rosae TaxID=37344 RepID=UPI0020340B0E|nr:odorant receptor 13a-like [Athalia rosae]